MSDFDIHAINLNLLPALEALLVEGSVGAAARRMHVSQSAMSHSLAKLRELFDDPLFEPSGRRLVPTARAMALSATLPLALEHLRDAMSPAQPFDPRASVRIFRLATVDHFELTALPDVLAHLQRHAPGVGLEIERFSPASLAHLVAGELDLALIGGSVPTPPTGLRRASLYHEPFAVIARPGHPRMGRRLDLGTYLALGHVLVSVEGRRDGVVDRALAKLGKTRRVALRVPHFISAPMAVLHSDHICTIPSSVARRAHELLGLRVLSPPLAVPAAEVVALWPERHENDPARRWFRDLFVSGRALSSHARALMRRRGVEGVSSRGGAAPSVSAEAENETRHETGVARGRTSRARRTRRPQGG
ncbi:LysR family transcriptional regulator [Pendulispora brunnea]|uniref:LysR family transcriptional regulator n=1 Tax=Pendulispora brunnea TaxID=2905690 RepID=A0ABZ2KB39_9BACT